MEGAMQRLLKFFERCVYIVSRWLFWVQMVRKDGTSIWVSKSEFYRPFVNLLKPQEIEFFFPLFQACGNSEDLRVGDVAQYTEHILQEYGVPRRVIEVTKHKLESVGLTLGMNTRW